MRGTATFLRKLNSLQQAICFCRVEHVRGSTAAAASDLRDTSRILIDPVSAQRLQTAILRSQKYLLQEQRPEGYWMGRLMDDSTLVSDTIAYHHWNGKVDREWQRKAVNHILSMQLADGGWNIYFGGPAEINATVKAYLALKLAGVPVTD